jgi:broad specificity phosphatase PhoE
MPRLYLVRHAKPAASWGEDPDPGLDDLGHEQALAAADRLSGLCEISHVYSSPLRRCRETAAPLAERWNCGVQLCREVAEIPSPPLSLAERHQWLRAAMRGSWAQLQDSAPAGAPNFLAWREEVVSALMRMPHDCVVYTHFIAINVAVGAAQRSEAVVCFRPDHASITMLENQPDGLRLLDLGAQADTSVLLGR